MITERIQIAWNLKKNSNSGKKKDFFDILDCTIWINDNQLRLVYSI